ncbi:transglycosylase SLT domain-containing protein [Streptomyces nodosus]|uniref:transglycosylase SLT domain-containing protein n=1 Tax=Streptomyces nodosus TaxID=40318 RepID=UPI003454B8E7
MASLMDILKKAGFKGEGLKMAYAIAMAESSGNARAHNGNAGTGDNSYGLFQINMLGGMGPERRKRYGLKSNDDLFDPLTNAKIAYAMSNGGKSWGPWSTYGNGMYKKYYGGSGAQVGNSSGGYYTGSGTASVTPKLDSATLAEQYGLTSSLINSSKELKKLFNQAVSGGWSAAKFGASLKNTKWWKTQSDSLRKYVTLKYTDPATWKQSQSAAQYKVNQLAVTVGLGNQLTGGKPSKLLQQAVYNSLALGWSDDRIKDWMGAKTAMHGGIMWGEAGDAFDKLHTAAYLNGMRYSSDWYKKNAVSVVSGKTTEETVEAQIRKAAAARYSSYSEQILAGQNVMDLAAPYIRSLSGLLELPETDVDLFNKHVSKAMTAKGGADGAQMPLWQFENEVRSDPLWRKTNNARESMMTVARQVARDFGLSY